MFANDSSERAPDDNNARLRPAKIVTLLNDLCDHVENFVHFLQKDALHDRAAAARTLLAKSSVQELERFIMRNVKCRQ
ncbi:hypothetical protein CBW24_16520 (plasmid) [Pacificitalea manganoxidans]|uniref:Uncharacterized protein n=1 Tax=Pacificitalea manganoxidans TaxID=1411902 RepID=A0A291M4I2_9RHOB|nr:hypothetical protein CBW24_16520 [Pacificitalea manganoxidans]